ncbi:UbiX family flavin prenyltransferase [Haloglycomyces albus]|uniref:UbiX family flavin prenyltransferase n=1 Tax=Haloglycomyces albus TaxID=526067 RepID=UPI00046CB789|nr:UbiX family flavin prenyltransferase [Haloglycomyces albus]
MDSQPSSNSATAGATEPSRQPWIVGITGASGSLYAAAVLRALIQAGHPVDLIISKAARLTLLDETGRNLRDRQWKDDVAAWLGIDLATADLRYWRADDFAAGPSSGSYRARGLIVVPATAAACAGIALGLSKDLIQRAGEVNLKEGRPVIVVPRETPASRSHLQNLLELHDVGAAVVPATPAFYAGSRDLQQVVDFLAGRILDVAAVDHDLYKRWNGTLGAARQ